MQINLSLSKLPIPVLSETLFHRQLMELKEISIRNNARFKSGYETKQYRNRKEELIQRLKQRASRRESFEQATDVVGRERLLVNIYTEYLGRSDAKSWLPEFDEKIARSVLGNPGKVWHQARLRQVKLLFFKQFDLLSALPYTCTRILEESNHGAGKFTDKRTWNSQIKVVFNPEGPRNVARSAKEKEDIKRLMDRYSIPDISRFAEKLRQEFLLEKIKFLPYGSKSPVFEEIERLKTERVSNNFLGAEALKIIVERVGNEGSSSWPDDWSRRITRLGCDPRYGRDSAEGAKWWGWATDSQLRLAQQGVTELSLRFFIDFLEISLKGTPKEPQFASRSRFLFSLFHARKIVSGRLALNKSDYQRLDPKYRDPYNVAILSGTTAKTSMICLHCINDIYIIEGTHSFGLRAFHPTFPLKGFWKMPQRTYTDSALRVRKSACPVFITHDPSGKWVKKFFSLLRSEFHIEWNDVNI